MAVSDSYSLSPGTQMVHLFYDVSFCPVWRVLWATRTVQHKDDAPTCCSAEDGFYYVFGGAREQPRASHMPGRSYC